MTRKPFHIDPFLRASLLCWILAVVVAAGLLGGCAGYQSWVKQTNDSPTGTVTAHNEECEESVVLRVIPAADFSKGAIAVALNQIKNPGYRIWALAINRKAIELVHDPQLTYDRFAEEIAAVTLACNKWWGADAIHLAEPLQDAFVGNLKVMNQCDRDYIESFCRIRELQLQSFLDLTAGQQMAMRIRMRSSALMDLTGRQAAGEGGVWHRQLRDRNR